MKPFLGQTLTVATTLALAVTLAPACAENDQAIFVRHTIAPPAARTGTSCLYTPDPTQPFISGGVVDAALRSSYTMHVLVGSQLIARGDPAQPRSESNRVRLSGAVVRVTDVNGLLLGEFTSLGSAFIDPAPGTNASFTPFFFNGIDAATLAKITAGGVTSKLVVVNAKVFGTTLGGVDVESGEFAFPVQVCTGCLVSFATGDDPLTDGVDCNLAKASAGGVTAAPPQAPCEFGQDESVPCQICSEALPACRGLVP